MNACTALAATVVACGQTAWWIGHVCPNTATVGHGRPFFSTCSSDGATFDFQLSLRPVGTQWDGARRDEVAVWSRFRVIAPRSNSPEHVPNHFGLTSTRVIN